MRGGGDDGDGRDDGAVGIAGDTRAELTGSQPQLDQFELVDLVSKGQHEMLEKIQALGPALGRLEEVVERVGELVPQLAIPEVLKVQEEALQLGRGLLVALLGQELGDWFRVDVHCACVYVCGGSYRANI